jgi:hypothetical protein
MAKKKSIFTMQYALVGIGIGLIIYTLLKKKGTNNSQQDNETQNDIITTPSLFDSDGCPIDRYGASPAAYLLDLSKVLTKKSPPVFEYETVVLQRKLNRQGACLKVDGYFEDKTEEAVKKLTSSSSVSLQTLTFFGL